MRVRMYMNTLDFSSKVEATISSIGFGVKSILKEDAEEIMEKSKAMCPEDTGALVNSAFVELTKDRLASPEYTFGYKGNTINPKTGEFSSTYAMKVHEDLFAYHTKGEAKFLEKAVIEHAQKYEASLSKKLAWLFKRGRA